MTYRVVLRARRDGSWQGYFFHEKDRLFMIPYNKQSSAEDMAAAEHGGHHLFFGGIERQELFETLLRKTPPDETLHK